MCMAFFIIGYILSTPEAYFLTACLITNILILPLYEVDFKLGLHKWCTQMDGKSKAPFNFLAVH